LSGILDVRVTSLPAERFLKLWKQNSLEIFLHGSVAGGLSRSPAGFTQPPALNLSHGRQLPGSTFRPRGFENTLDRGVTPLRRLSIFIWTSHDANLFSTVVTRRPRVPPSCSKRIWFRNLGGHKMEGRAWASVPRPCMVILLRPGKRFRS
jgi:hypothetical protein